MLPGILRFLSTPSARRATQLVIGAADFHTDFYPRPPRGGRLRLRAKKLVLRVISIHALREEGDPPRAPRSGLRQIFLSTPSARRATYETGLQQGDRQISIHALREEGDPAPAQNTGRCRNFYPRPPRGGRLTTGFTVGASIVFLSTPSARRATRHQQRILQDAQISIHALREEGDRAGHIAAHFGNISIHALREEGDTTERR